MTRRGLLLLVLALVAGLLIYWQVSDAAKPVATGRTMVPVNVPELTPVQARGRDTFAASCAACHGDTAGGLEGRGPPLVHRIYEPGHHADITFERAVANGVRSHHWRFGDMPPVADVSPDQVAAIIAYVRALQRANGID